MSLAPIVLFVYNRPWHTQQTIESLKRNLLADESVLFIFSDGPKNHADEQKVSEVRTYIKSIDNFKSINICESENNKGLANSVIDGVTSVFKEYSRVIVLEDDLFLTDGFLKYINDGLQFYQNNQKIFSITGYCPPIRIPADYHKNVFFSCRAASWGWATYKSKWNQVDWKISAFNKFDHDRELQKNFNIWGADLTPMLKAQFYGFIDSWAIRWSYTHFQNYAFCVYPVKSLIKNIGTDNSGTHFTSTTKYDVELSNFYNLNFSDQIEPDDRILLEINNLVKPSLIRKAVNYFRFNNFLNQLIRS